MEQVFRNASFLPVILHLTRRAGSVCMFKSSYPIASMAYCFIIWDPDSHMQGCTHCFSLWTDQLIGKNDSWRFVKTPLGGAGIWPHISTIDRYGVLCNLIWAGPLSSTSMKTGAERPASQDVSAALKRRGDAEQCSNCVRPSHRLAPVQTVVCGYSQGSVCSRQQTWKDMFVLICRYSSYPDGLFWLWFTHAPAVHVKKEAIKRL